MVRKYDREFEDAVGSVKQVRKFQVPVNDPLAVQVLDCQEELVDEALYLLFVGPGKQQVTTAAPNRAMLLLLSLLLVFQQTQTAGARISIKRICVRATGWVWPKSPPSLRGGGFVCPIVYRQYIDSIGWMLRDRHDRRPTGRWVGGLGPVKIGISVGFF